ncbi:MAG: nucleoside hydrolase [Actinomycetota bacterium]
MRCVLAVIVVGLLAGLAAAASAELQVAPSSDRKPVPVIFDTDIGPDVDDAGTTALLNALADRGEARILAMGCCTSSEWGAPCLDAINTYYGRPAIPIGTFKGEGFLSDPKTDSKYNRQIAQEFPNDLRSGKNAPDATETYRRVLSKQRDASVVVCAVGPLNNLSRLLSSGPDRHSKLTGAQLVKKKVRRLVVMGGKFPEGKEWNFEQAPDAAARVMAEWPTPILASGFEIGSKVFTGKRLGSETPAENPVRRAYELYIGAGKDRESWDQTALYAAIRGHEPLWDLRVNGTILVDPAKKGANTWTGGSGAQHAFLVERAPIEEVRRSIEDLMVRPPMRSRKD